MPKETAPAFQFYVKEWRSSRAVMRMSFAERGMYLEMLLEQWENCSLPDDPKAVSELIGGSVDEWTAAWPVLRRKFADRRIDPREGSTPGAQNRIVNLKLEEVRRGLKKFIRVAKKGGESRAKSAKRGSNGTYLPAESPATFPATEPADIQPSASTASATASATATKNKYTDRFAEFWDAYPRKVGKDAARRIYEKRRPDEEIHAQMLAAIESQRRSPAWVKDGGQFIPHPSTWLSQGRWQDEPLEVHSRGMPRSRWQDDCDHEPPCGSPTTCDNLHKIAAYKAEQKVLV